MRILEEAPDFARKRLQEAVDTHPGRPDDDHLGISTMTWDPTLTRMRIRGKPLPEDEDQGSRAKGTVLHQTVYGDAPNGETEVRLEIPETGGLYWHGHFDCLTPDGALRDLKTSSSYQLTDDKREDYLDQLALYALAIERGEARTPDGDWNPASEVLGVDKVETLIVDWWGGRGLEWEAIRLDGDGVGQRMTQAYEEYGQMVRAMVAGTWEPDGSTTDEVTSDEAALDDLVEAPEDLHELVMEAGWAKEQKEQHEQAYDEKREKIHEIQAKTVEDSIVVGPYQAVYNSPGTKQELDVEKARKLLDEHTDENLDAYREDVPTATVTDEQGLAERLDDLGLTGIEGIEIGTETRLDEERLQDALEAIDTPDLEAHGNALSACLEEKQTRNGYTYIQRRDA
ncbi:hypothetical protein BRD56_02530 [Thermoplasmatales archaeon SW_10_69_26]|nr:MAG: hypothetical protein BRD56_02530 [Thermoplasmatales archaeon SW_10_69_26]